VSDCKNAD